MRAAIIALLLTTGAAYAEQNDVTVSVHGIYNGGAQVNVWNKSSALLDSVFLHCTFRGGDGARIDDVPVFLTGLAPGDVAKERADMPNSIIAHSVECRVDYAKRS